MSNIQNNANSFTPPKRRYIFRRLFARLIDASIICLLTALATGDFSYNFLNAFLLYNFLFCFLSGNTIGKVLVGLRVVTDKHKIWRALGREILVWLLWWALFFELIFSEKPFVHERYSATNLIVKT